MSNVLVEKNKLDILANAISNKSGEPLTLTLDEMVEAVDGIEQGIQPSGNINITQTGQTDVTNYATATVSALSSDHVDLDIQRYYITRSGQRKWELKPYFQNTGDDGAMVNGYERYSGNTTVFNAIPTGTTVTPTTSAQTIGGANYMMEGAVTVNAVPSASFGIPTNNTTVENGKWNYTRSYPNFSAGYLANHPPVEVSISLEDKTVTPSASQQVITPTDKLKYLNSVTVSAMPSGTEGTPTATKGTVSNHSVSVTPSVTNTTGYITGGTINGTAVTVSASELVSGSETKTANGTYDVTNLAELVVDVPSVSPNLQDKTVTPTTGQQTVNADSGYDGLDTVTVNAMPIGNKGSANISVTKTASYLNVTVSNPNATDGYYTKANINSGNTGALVLEDKTATPSASSQTITPTSNYYYLNSVTVDAMPSGTAGTPTATKGTVSNHSVSVTPSVTNTTGYITGSTKTGTAVTVSASELVSGSETKTENGTYDVTNLAEIVVDVQGGGSSTISVGKTTKTLASASSSIQFTGLSGNPTSFVVTSSADITANTNGVTAVVFDGTSLHGQILSTQATADTGFTKSYSGGTLTITATTGSFQANEYKLAYTYGGSTSDIETADVQVGSGATSITFSVTGRPVYWSCIFKSDFSTSSGYQRVIEVVNDGSSTYGMCLDSSAHASSSYWTASYSGGSLTISSQGTNQGGYFHQPGYYQLTYAVDDSAPEYQSKTVTPTTSQQVVTPDSGYDALESVTVNAIPSQYIIPSGNFAITQNGNNINVSQYATVSVNVSGGGSSTCDTKTMTNSNDQATSIEFTGLSGQPKWFFVRCTSQLTRSSSYSYYYITAVRYNGTNHNGNYYRRSNGTFYNDTTHYSHTYSNGTLTVSSSASRGAAGGSFYNGGYELVYVY